MALIRAQVILPYFTGLPEDVATNTLYFATGGGVVGPPASGPEQTEIVLRLQAAYNEVATYIAPIVSRPLTRIKLYDMADTPPRQPLTGEFDLNLTAGGGTASLPLEVAAVLSFHTTFLSGVPNARRRGRIYVGPLTPLVIGPGTATQFPTFLAAFITAMQDFATALATPVNPLEVVAWHQYSPTTGDSSIVIGGWVDNEADTQRRRQARATIRNTFTVPVPG